MPSFYELLVQLKQRGQPFSVVFRTFGEDLEAVVADLNAFCEGKNPCFPDVKMDGSDGDPDYRIKLDKPSQWGTWHYDEVGCLSLIMGTIEQAGEGKYKKEKDRSLDFYKGSDFKDLQIVPGFKDVKKF